MEVWKFGGTSVGSPQRMREVAELIHTGKQRWIVLSAVSVCNPVKLTTQSGLN